MRAKRLGLFSAIAIVMSVAAAQVAHGAAIGINFSAGQGNATNLAPLASTDSTGVFTQANWNNASTAPGGTTANVASPNAGVLVDSNGAVTAAGITWSSTNSWSVVNGTRTPEIAELLNGYLDNTNAATPTSVTVTGIPYATYNVIAYVGSDGNGRTGHATIGAQTFYYSTNTNQNPPTFVQSTATTLAGATAATYVEFDNLSGSTFTLTNTRDSNNTGLHGIQIVDASAAPEPGSAAVLLIGGAAAFLKRRRRQA